MPKRNPDDLRALPSFQLGIVVQNLIDRRTRELNWPFAATGSQHYCHEMVCAEAGCTTRNLRRWLDGSQPRVRLDTADTVLTNLDLLWWDVWNEETVRKPVVRVLTRKWRPKRSQSGNRRMIRCRERGEILYGDLGPDWDLLAQIERVWCGMPVQDTLDVAA